MASVGFHYGAFADPIEKQANAQGFTLGENAERIEACADAINLLYVCGYINDVQRSKSLQRLQKEIVKSLKEEVNK